MKNIKDFSNGVIKDHIKKNIMVYHYTSPIGIYSIIQDEKLWFTDCQYLNDKSEYMHIKKPLLEAFKQRGEKDNESFIDRLLFSELYESYGVVYSDKSIGRSKLKLHRYFVFCASICSDTQNMWNYYVKNGQNLGYNLGIDVHTLVEHFANIPNVTVTHGKVLYNELRQVNLIKNFLDRLDVEIEPLKKRYDNAVMQGVDEQSLYFIESDFADYYQESLSDYIDERRLFYKHKAFEAEKEYRIVVKVPIDFNADFFELKHRVNTNGVITPYRELSITKEAQLFSRITLSPMIEIEHANAGLQSILNKKSKKNIEIVNSNIKIRF